MKKGFNWKTESEIIVWLKKQALEEGRTASEILESAFFMYINFRNQCKEEHKNIDSD